MGPQHLIDTNAVIDYFNGRIPANGRQLFAEIIPTISVITHIELFSSAQIVAAELLQLHQFVQVATVYDTLTIDIVKQTAALRIQYRIKVPDAIIAATAMVYDLKLITRDVADFSSVNGLQLINPYNL